MHIDLKKILKGRVTGWKRALIPNPVISGLERIVCQDELNRLLDATEGLTGSAFADGLFRELDISFTVRGLENIPADTRIVFASNHPLGGLDGIGLVKVIGELYGDDNFRVLVNDMLMHVEPLREVFLPINKYGAQGRKAAVAINEAYASPKQIVMFPAGLVSRLNAEGQIRDLEWQKSFVAKAIEYHRMIVPVHFEGLNRRRFYNLARWRRRLHIGINIEQAFLPAELCAARGNGFTVTFLPPVDPSRLRAEGLTLTQIAAAIRASVYE